MALCSKVHASTNAESEGLKVGDTIFMIDDEFVCGVSLKDGLEMLSGFADTTVCLIVNRVQGNIKARLTFEIMRDFDHKPMDAERLARKKSSKDASLAERSFASLTIFPAARILRRGRKCPPV